MPIGIIGAGSIGQAWARRFVNAACSVVRSNRRFAASRWSWPRSEAR